MHAKQLHSALKLEAEVQQDGRLELYVPLPVGAKVVVFVLEEEPEEFTDLIDAAQSSLDFWDNPLDDEDWNDA